MESTARDSSASSSGLSIRTKLTIFVALVAIVSITLINWLTFTFTYDNVTEQIDRRLSTLSHDREMRLNAYIDQQKERLKLITSRTQLRTLLRNRLQETDRIAAPVDPAASGSVPDFRVRTTEILQDAAEAQKNFRRF